MSDKAIVASLASRIIYIGESFYDFFGLKEILSGHYNFMEITHISLNEKPLIYPSIMVNKSDLVIVSPSEQSILKYASLVRGIKRISKCKMIIFSTKKIHSLLEVLCGSELSFIQHSSPLESIYQEVISFAEKPEKKTLLGKARKKITDTEFKILMMITKGWNLSEIALMSHNSIKTISTHKVNISKKLGIKNNELKFFITNKNSSSFYD